MTRLGVMTSGGDAPGMNAAIRSAVRIGCTLGCEMVGVQHGFAGLMAGDFRPLDVRAVGGIMQRGGTMLGSARAPEFKTEAGRQQALQALSDAGVDGLVIIGGNGTQTGAHALWQRGFPVVGVASTIDNDLVGSDITLGVDTALKIALEAIDRLKTTASSHRRGFLVEVMGRDCGYLALMAAIAGGAEAVTLPEIETDPEQVAADILAAYARGQSHAIVVSAEGSKYPAAALAEHFRTHQDQLGFDLRVVTLGHTQRGGAPGAFDRLLGTRLAAAAVERLATGQAGVLAGMLNGRIAFTPLDDVVSGRKTLDPDLIALARRLAT
ncbi:MAG: 6-phosphofructokinase [Candidatus Sericytochromatia bacterium]|nr:6-phosphofructokinase [Candidatus Sericytochromatia bacterium]